MTRRSLRDDPDQVRELVHAWVPDREHRLALLACLANSIEIAHAQGRGERWAVTVYSNLIRLNVGHVELFVLSDSGPFFVIAPSHTSPRSPEVSLDPRGYKNIPGSQRVVGPAAAIPAEYQHVAEAHREAIEIAARKPMFPATRAAHSPSVLAFLRQELGRNLPDPVPVTPAATAVGVLSRRPYEDVAENVVLAESAPPPDDRAARERGASAHNRTQNQLAAHVAKLGYTRELMSVGQLEFDLAWEGPAALCVAEVKSTTADNERDQLRAGLGQILEYRLRAERAQDRPVEAFLVCESKPADDIWQSVCKGVGVTLSWAPEFPFVE